ncbi:MAG TPA: hypothetical protein VGE96_04550 [Steroidobacteraceae bacterium]|jgi:hypothetical protein
MTTPSRRLSSAYLRTLVLVSAGMVFATFMLRWGLTPLHVLAPLNLTNENVVAAWFSGMLLLLGSLHAADGYFRLRQKNLHAALAWCVIALMLFGLSLDEIGSLHERADEYLKMGKWLSFLPFFIALLAGCTWSILTLWFTPSERPTVPGLVIGFAILVSVGGQEWLEHAFQWPWYLVPFRAAFEEGSELLGMLILICTMVHNSMGLFSSARPPRKPAFSSVPALRWPIVIVGAGIAWPMAQLSTVLDLPAVLGHPSDWLAAVLFVFAALLLLNKWSQSPDGGRFPASTIAWLCFASALCVQINPIGESEAFPFSHPAGVLGIELNLRLVLLALCCFGASESLRARPQGHGYRAGGLLLLVAAVLSVWLATFSAPNPLRWAYFATTTVSLTAFTALAHALRQRASVAQVFARA